MVAALHLHPIVDHFTIALLSVAVLCDLAGIAGGVFLRLRQCAFVLMICGALAAVGSYLSGDADANRLWDTMPPAAQTLLFSDSGAARMLAHATLGRYLMFAFVVLAAWRIALELLPRMARSRPAYLLAALVAASALLYQGKTGGELVYDYAVGTRAAAAPSVSRSALDASAQY